MRDVAPGIFEPSDCEQIVFTSPRSPPKEEKPTHEMRYRLRKALAYFDPSILIPAARIV